MRVQVAIGRGGSGSGLDRTGQVSLIFWKKSGWIGSGQARVGSGQFKFCIFFRSLINFDLIEDHLISGRIGSGRVRVRLDQFVFFKKSDRFRFGSERIFQIGSGSVTFTCDEVYN
jgi:hypothetical protein